MPMSVIERMAAGLPVITTRVGGIADLIDDGTEGLLFEPGDVAALTQKISFWQTTSDLGSRWEKGPGKGVDEQMSFSSSVRGFAARSITFATWRSDMTIRPPSGKAFHQIGGIRGKGWFRISANCKRLRPRSGIPPCGRQYRESGA